MSKYTDNQDISQSLSISGKVLNVSQEWLNFSGYTQEEVLGEHFTSFLSPESFACVHKNFPTLKEYGHVNNVALKFKHKDGRLIDVILNGVSTYDKQGNFLHTNCKLKTLDYFLESKQNIQILLEETNHLNQELLLAKKNLLEEKKLFRLAQSIAHIGHWKLDTSKNECYWSDEVYKMFGYEAQSFEASFEAYVQTIHPQDKERVLKAFEDSLEQDISFDVTHRSLRQDGSIFYVRDQGHNLKNSEGTITGSMGTAFDITEQVMAQKQLEIEKEKAIEANESKAQFLANMSHEIRTPMNAILGFVDILCKDECKDERKEQFKIIKSSGTALLHIINDILDFSKLQSQKLHIETIEFNPQETFSNAIKLYSGLARDNELNFNYSISKDLPSLCLGDEFRLKQIISNLISNAIKFTPKEGYVQVNVNYVNQRIFVSVEDSGLGIASDKLDKIFNMFEQEDSSVTRKFGGTGLGLAISKELVEMMDGELIVRSQVGLGSYFGFNLPLLPTQAKNKVKEQHNEKKELTGKVLLVEDNKSNQLLMSIFLSELGLEYDIANDGVEALEKVKHLHYENRRYKAILMDENMPNMNGTQASKEIRKLEYGEEPSIIIAVTANALSSDRERFLRAGMDDYISKPVEQDKIEEVLRKFM